MRRRLVLPALLLLATPALAACNGLGSTTQAQGFISTDGTVSEIAPADRGAPIDLSGTTLEGKPLSLSTYRGKPVVVNVWGSWCDPCIQEAPDLADAASQTTVPFVGIDIRDTSADNARSYNTSFGITYPSVYDPSSSALLAFREYPVQSPPTTFVLDAQGRVAATVVGVLPSTQTLLDLIDDVRSGA